MSGNSQEKQPAVRPGLLVVLLFALGGALYWSFFMQPKPAPISPTSPATAVPPLTGNINDKYTEDQLTTPSLKMGTGPISKRDLFLPPPSIIAARRRKDQTTRPTVPPNQPVRDDLQLIRPDQGLLPIAKPDENPEKPVLKGILGTENSQVIIVRYQNKSYLLKLGEILPGTKYRVGEINNDSVILITPKGRVKLDKKERAK
ncbi:MAG: hypothetical protein GXY86_16375 [Firmicutes bacterium]|nr:hypothetical protein [Bacillota bacterium]